MQNGAKNVGKVVFPVAEEEFSRFLAGLGGFSGFVSRRHYVTMTPMTTAFLLVVLCLWVFSKGRNCCFVTNLLVFFSILNLH